MSFKIPIVVVNDSDDDDLLVKKGIKTEPKKQPVNYTSDGMATSPSNHEEEDVDVDTKSLSKTKLEKEKKRKCEYEAIEEDPKLEAEIDSIKYRIIFLKSIVSQ